MATTFKRFAAKMIKIEKRLPIRVNKLAIQTANDALIALTSPTVLKVDTSKAVSNVRVGLGVKSTAVRSPFFPGKRNSTGAASRAETRLIGKIRISAKQPGVAVHITNNVPYLDNALIKPVEQVLEPVRAKLKDRAKRFKL